MKLAPLIAIIVSLIGLCHSFYDIGFCARVEVFKCDKESKACSKKFICKIFMDESGEPEFFKNIEECKKNC